MDNTIALVTTKAEQSHSDSPSLENPLVIAPQPRLTGSVFRELQDVECGKPSVVNSYCQQAIDRGHRECIWLCIKRGRKWIAKDIQLGIEDRPLGIYELRKQCGWWKRHSLFSAVGVKEIKIRFHSISEVPNEVEVVLMDFDYTTAARNLDRAFDEASNQDVEFGECGIDIMGRSHEPNIVCPNEAYDEWMGTYCKAQCRRKLRQEKEENEWLPSMLEFYWQNGIESKGVEFLKAAGFIVSYDGLQYDQYQHAANPYGKSINAFKIVEGWHLRYLLCLVAASVFCSICVVAVVTAATQSFDSGLATGSYALALAAVCLAVLTFLSAVL